MAPPCSKHSNTETKVSNKLILSEHKKLHKPAKSRGIETISRSVFSSQMCLQSDFSSLISIFHKMDLILVSFSSVQSLSCVQLFATPSAAGQASLSITTPGVYSNSCPLSWWRQPTISSYVIPFSSHLQSFPASGSFQMSQFFTSNGPSIGVSASASVLPMNIQSFQWISNEYYGVCMC